MRQKTQSKHSIMEGYLLQETIENCQDFLRDVRMYAPRAWRLQYNLKWYRMNISNIVKIQK